MSRGERARARVFCDTVATMGKFAATLGVLLTITGCGHARSHQRPPPALAAAVERYIEVYAARQDLTGFVELFAPDGVLVDVMLRQRFEGRKAIADFYAWDAPGFALADPAAPVIVVESVAYTENIATLRGHFSAFSWQGTAYPASPFVIRLRYSQAAQIVEQEDWIAYPRGLLCEP